LVNASNVVDCRDKITGLFAQLYRIETDEDDIFSNKLEMQDFWARARKIAPEACKTREEIAPFDFGSAPDIIMGLRSHKAKLMEFEDSIYYGEVRIDQPDVPCGKGIKVFKKSKQIDEAWFYSESTIVGRGRWIGGVSRQTYEGDYTNS
jgi:hypothetical protein